MNHEDLDGWICFLCLINARHENLLSWTRHKTHSNTKFSSMSVQIINHMVDNISSLSGTWHPCSSLSDSSSHASLIRGQQAATSDPGTVPSHQYIPLGVDLLLRANIPASVRRGQGYADAEQDFSVGFCGLCGDARAICAIV